MVRGTDTVKPKVKRSGYVSKNVRCFPSERMRTAPTIDGIEW